MTEGVFGLEFLVTDWRVATLALVLGFGFVFWLMSRVPYEARWVHEYEAPEGTYAKSNYPRLIAFLLVVLAVSVPLDLMLLPTGIPALLDYLRQNWWMGLATSPKFLLAVSFLVAEFFLFGLFLCWLGLLAQAEAPKMPIWLAELLALLAFIATFALELISLPTGPLGIIIALLASFIIALAMMFAFWASFPMSPLRAWFCANIVPWFWTPLEWMWGTVWICLVESFRLAYRIWSAVYTFYDYVVQNIPVWVHKTIFVKQPVRRLIRVFVPAAPAWMPAWMVKAGDVILDVVDTFLEVIEWIVVAVVTLVLELIAIIIYIIVTVLIWGIEMWIEIFCLVWALAVLVWSFFFAWFWLLPFAIVRLIMWN